MPRDRKKEREYQRIWASKRYAENRARAVAYLGGKCASCGSSGDLEFDHTDRTQKSFDIAKKLNGIPWEALKIELDKCKLLCVACHVHKSSVSHDLSHRGETNPAAMLTDEIVTYIKANWKKGSRDLGCAALARKFGVHSSTVRLVVIGETWK